MKARVLSILSTAILSVSAFGQTLEYKKASNHANHEDHKYELGMAHAPVYFFKEKEFTYGLHLHLTRTIGESRFALGLGYERIFDEHQHNTISAVVSFRPADRLNINFAPGVTYEGTHTDEMLFAFHYEMEYGFEVGDFHIGPSFELAYDPHDYHISLGLHIGYGF